MNDTNQYAPKEGLFADIMRMIRFTDKDIKNIIFLQQSRIIYLMGAVLTLLYFARIIPFQLTYPDHPVFVYLVILQGSVALLVAILYRLNLGFYEKIITLFVLCNVGAEFEIIIQTHLIHNISSEVMSVYVSILLYGMAIVFPVGFKRFFIVNLILLGYHTFRIFQIYGLNSYSLTNAVNNIIIYCLAAVFHIYLIYLRYTNIEKTIALGKANHKLQELDGLKTRFFENISHELKTPITIIHAIAHEQLKSGSREGKQSAEIILNHTLRLEKMVKNILELSKIQEGETPVNLANADLPVFLTEIARPFTEVARAKGIKLKTVLPRKLELVSDYEKVEIILYNLLSNAIKYSQGGTIVVSAFKRNGKAFIRVKDQGHGIATEDQERIFSRFVRGEQAFHIEGIGIGLTLAREYANLLGGSLTFTSVPGKKTVFTLALNATGNALLLQPVATEKTRNSYLVDLSDKDKQPGSSDKLYKGGKILIVDDNPYILNLLGEILGKHWNIHQCSSATEALALLKTYKPRLIVSDIMMPGVSGTEFLLTIRENFKEYIPVLFLTALSDAKAVEDGLRFGADDYLVKPFNPDELVYRVRNLLNTEERKNEDIHLARSRLFNEIHDSIGAELTDLLMIANQENSNVSAETMKSINIKLKNIKGYLKQSLNMLEDLEFMEKDFLTGLNLLLLRRYSAAGRSLVFNMEKFQGTSWEKNRKEGLFFITREIATNDLKYGFGESVWNFTGTPDRLMIEFSSQTSQPESKGWGRNIIEKRITEIGGRMKEELIDNKIMININLGL